MIKNFTTLIIAFSGLIGFTPDAVGQTTTFDNMNSNVGSQKSISWTSSSFGSGFGHRLISIDPGEFTTLNLQARHNSATWKDVMVVTSTGRFGIGINNPLHQFHFLSTAGQRSRFQYGNVTLDLVDYSASTEGFTNSAGLFMNGKDGLIMTGQGYHLKFVTNETGPYVERMRISRNGNVGIGESNPTVKLAVKGVIKSYEINVTTTNWPDYVFAPEYQLMPLSELETFIQKNGHLPDVPTEAEVMENGINLAEMNVKLLEKLEELTLHTIRQEKLIEELFKRIQNDED